MSEKIAVYIDGENISWRLYNLIEDVIKEFGKIFIFNIYTKKGSNDYENWNKISENCKLIKCQNVNIKDWVDGILIQQLKGDLKKYNNITLFFIISSDNDFNILKPIIEKKEKNIKFIKQNNNSSLILNGKIIIYNYEKEELKKEIKKELKDQIKKEIKKK